MKTVELLRTLDRWDESGLWAFDIARLKMLFNESPDTLRTSLMRHAKEGIILRIARGVYVNPRSRHIPPDPLLQLVSFIRPFEFSYESLESVLSEAGWISQIPTCYTLISTGRTAVYYTPYGVLDFTHSSTVPSPQELSYSSSKGIYVATPRRAYEDLRRVNRNLDLVEVPDDEDAGDTGMDYATGAVTDDTISHTISPRELPVSTP